MYFLDTNIFLRVLAKDDERSFGECKKILDKVKRGEIDGVTANLVLVEVLWTLESYYGWNKKRVVRSLRSIVSLGGLRIVDGYTPDAALGKYGAKGVKFVDAMIASIEEIWVKDWVVVSYDRDFDKLGVVRKEPGEVYDKN